MTILGHSPFLELHNNYHTVKWLTVYLPLPDGQPIINPSIPIVVPLWLVTHPLFCRSSDPISYQADFKSHWTHRIYPIISPGYSINHQFCIWIEHAIVLGTIAPWTIHELPLYSHSIPTIVPSNSIRQEIPTISLRWDNICLTFPLRPGIVCYAFQKLQRFWPKSASLAGTNGSVETDPSWRSFGDGYVGHMLGIPSGYD